MTYGYKCVSCHRNFDIVKSVKDIDVNEYCPRCGEPGERMLVPERLYISGAKVQHAEYNPAFGCVVKNKHHRDELAKEKGLVEVGNDFKSGDAMQSSADKAREDKKKKEWDAV